MSAANPTNVNADGTPLCDAKTLRGALCRQKGRYGGFNGELFCGGHAKDDPVALQNKDSNTVYTDTTSILGQPFTDSPRHALFPNAAMPVHAIAKVTGDMDQIISISMFALDSPVLRLGSNIFGAATAIQDAFVAEFTARIWDTTTIFPNLLTDTGRVIYSATPPCQVVPLHWACFYLTLGPSSTDSRTISRYLKLSAPSSPMATPTPYPASSPTSKD
jgi:hypothetical protein